MLVMALGILSGCEAGDRSAQAVDEIGAAEAAFAQMAKEKGVPAAFLAFAADNGVLLRNNSIIEGHDAMKAYFDSSTLDSVQLTWSPDKIVAAKSGDLGYTYGKYLFSALDSSGQTISSEGIFHTVWQKQTDGTWKFVWD